MSSNIQDFTKDLPEVPVTAVQPNWTKDLPEPPKGFPQPKKTDYKSTLAEYAIKFILSPKLSEDERLIKAYYNKVVELFKQETYEMNNTELALATVTAYLSHKTKKSGGKHTLRIKKHNKSTRKHKQR